MESNKQVTFKSRSYFLPGTYLYRFKQQLKYNGVATLITTTLLAPLERWRIIAQTQKSFPLRMKKFKGFFDYVSRIPKEQGLTAFWRGNTPTFWIYLYQTIFQIGIYDSIKKLGSELNAELSEFPYAIPIFDRFLFPLFASYFTLVLVHPIDTYRIHKSMSYHKQKSDAIATKFRYRIHQTGGIKQLYKGFYLANLIGLINFNFYKSLYTTIEKFEVSGVPQDILNAELVISLLCVGLAHPLDTLKKVYQLNNLHKPPLFTNLKGVINYLKNNKIELSLYNGFVPSIVKTALYIPVFWQVLKLWRNMVDSKQITSKFGF